MEKVKSNSGNPFIQAMSIDFILWIYIKSEDKETYQVIHQQLLKYQNMLTKFTPSGVRPGAVTVYISGNRPRALMESQSVRYAAYDGRMSDFGTDVSNEFMPIISDNWTKHFTWMGIGEMPSEERGEIEYNRFNFSCEWTKGSLLGNPRCLLLSEKQSGTN